MTSGLRDSESVASEARFYSPSMFSLGNVIRATCERELSRIILNRLCSFKLILAHFAQVIKLVLYLVGITCGRLEPMHTISRHV